VRARAYPRFVPRKSAAAAVDLAPIVERVLGDVRASGAVAKRGLPKLPVLARKELEARMVASGC